MDSYVRRFTTQINKTSKMSIQYQLSVYNRLWNNNNGKIAQTLNKLHSTCILFITIHIENNSSHFNLLCIAGWGSSKKKSPTHPKSSRGSSPAASRSLVPSMWLMLSSPPPPSMPVPAPWPPPDLLLDPEPPESFLPFVSRAVASPTTRMACKRITVVSALRSTKSHLTVQH